MGDYDAPPHERLENVRAERDAARRELAEARAAFAADLARAEAEHEQLASVIRTMVEHLDRWGVVYSHDEQVGSLAAALGKD